MPELPFIFPSTHPERAVLRLLRSSERYDNSRAWHVIEIARELGMDERLVRKCVANLVKQGEPILSGTAGYFFPHTAEDVERACASYKKRVLSLLRRIKCLKENTTYKELLGQLRLALEEK